MSMYGKIRSMEKKTISKLVLKGDIVSCSEHLENVEDADNTSSSRMEADIEDQSKIENIIKRGVDESNV